MYNYEATSYLWVDGLGRLREAGTHAHTLSLSHTHRLAHTTGYVGTQLGVGGWDRRGGVPGGKGGLPLLVQVRPRFLSRRC